MKLLILSVLAFTSVYADRQLDEIDVRGTSTRLVRPSLMQTLTSGIDGQGWFSSGGSGRSLKRPLPHRPYDLPLSLYNQETGMMSWERDRAGLVLHYDFGDDVPDPADYDLWLHIRWTLQGTSPGTTAVLGVSQSNCGAVSQSRSYWNTDCAAENIGKFTQACYCSECPCNIGFRSCKQNPWELKRKLPTTQPVSSTIKLFGFPAKTPPYTKKMTTQVITFKPGVLGFHQQVTVSINITNTFILVLPKNQTEWNIKPEVHSDTTPLYSEPICGMPSPSPPPPSSPPPASPPTNPVPASPPPAPMSPMNALRVISNTEDDRDVYRSYGEQKKHRLMTTLPDGVRIVYPNKYQEISVLLKGSLYWEADESARTQPMLMPKQPLEMGQFLYQPPLGVKMPYARTIQNGFVLHFPFSNNIPNPNNHDMWLHVNWTAVGNFKSSAAVGIQQSNCGEQRLDTGLYNQPCRAEHVPMGYSYDTTPCYCNACPCVLKSAKCETKSWALTTLPGGIPQTTPIKLRPFIHQPPKGARKEVTQVITLKPTITASNDNYANNSIFIHDVFIAVLPKGYKPPPPDPAPHYGDVWICGMNMPNPPSAPPGAPMATPTPAPPPPPSFPPGFVPQPLQRANNEK